MKTATQRHISIKLLQIKDKKKILKAAKEKKRHITYGKTKIIMIAEFLLKTMQTRKQWTNKFEVLNEETVNLEFYIQ